MSFCRKNKTLRSGNTYDLHASPETFVQYDETTVATEIDATERNDEIKLGFSPEMIEKNQGEPRTFLCPDLCPNTDDGQVNPRQLG